MRWLHTDGGCATISHSSERCPTSDVRKEVPVRTVLYLIGFICFIIVVADAWRSPASTATKILWTVLGFLFSIVTLVVWFAWGRNRAYS